MSSGKKLRLRPTSWPLLALSLALASPVFAQQYPQYVQRVWETEDGLPLRRLFNSSMVQTQDGYLWIGTRVGLLRFDGMRFERFTANNTENLPDKSISTLFESGDGSLWISTWEGNLIRYRDRTFEPFLSADAHTPSPTYITAFFEDRHGTLWIATHRGVMRLVDGRFELVPVTDRLLVVESLLVEDDSTFWVSAGKDGVFKWQNGETTHFGSDDGLFSNFTVNIYRGEDERIWVEHPQGKISYIDSTGAHAFQFPGSDQNQLHFLRKDSFGRLWLSVGPSLYHHRDGDWYEVSVGEEITTLFPESFSLMRTVVGKDLDKPWYSWELAMLGEVVPDQLAPLPSESLESPRHQYEGSQILRDREENIWLSGFHTGLTRLKPALFETIPSELFSTVTDGDEREEFNFRTLGKSRDGSIWMIGLLSALTQRLPDGTYQRYGTAPEFIFPSYSFTEDRTGTVWVNGAICHRDARGICDRFESINALQGRIVHVSLEDPEGTMWFGTDDGVSRFVPASNPTRPELGQWTHFNEANGLPYGRIESMAVARNGGMWFGSNGGGLFYFHNGKFSHWTRAEGLSGVNLNSIHEDESGILWLGSGDRGLIRVEFDGTPGPHSGQMPIQVTTYGQREGLFETGITSLIKDSQDRLWMGSRHGIFWVSLEDLNAHARGDLQNVQSTAYTTADGMIDHEANTGGSSTLESRDGKLWFATQYGAVVVDPSKVKPNPIAPPVVIESARSRLTPVTLENNSAVFEAEQRDFEITFTGLSLAAPSLVRFRYLLEGYDRDWVEAGTRRSATYTRVPSGTYTFKVIAANNEGVWSEEGATLSVRVMPFVWETWWFRALSLLFVGFVIIALDRLRVRRLVARKQHLEHTIAERTLQLRKEKELTESQANRLLELDKLKSQSFENISHEFRTPLTLIMGPLQQILAGKRGDLPESLVLSHEMMLRHSARLLRLTNQILDLARVESGLFKSDMSNQDIIPLIREAVLVFSTLAERKRIGMTLEGVRNPDGTFVVCVLAFDREMMRKVFANLLSNALKFTDEDGQVSIVFRQLGEAIEVELRDNGPGIPKEGLESIFKRFSRIEDANRIRHSGTGIGLSIAKEFTEKHGGTLGVNSEVGIGTSFIVRLPIVLGDEDTAQPSETALAEPLPGQQNSWLDLEPDLLPITGESSDEILDQDDKVTILVVDDHQDIRSFIRSLLESQFKVLEAADGVEGLELAREHLPDLIIADVMMPRMDGLEFNRELKQDRALSAVPVILLTARATSADHEAGLATEVDQYLTKPFDPDVLVARIQSLLRIRHRLRDLLQKDADAAIKIELSKEAKAIQEPEPVVLSAFTEKGMAIIRQNLANPNFSVDDLANEMLLSRWQLRRRLVEEAGMTPNALIRQIRLEEASKLLSTRAGNVSEIAFAVGFQSLSHFSRSFKAQFNMSPSEFASSDE